MEDSGAMAEIVKGLGGTAGLVTAGALAAGALYWGFFPSTPNYDMDMLENQTIEVPGVPHARMSKLCKETGTLLTTYYEDSTTIYEAFLRGARTSDNGPCLGHRPGSSSPYQWIPYEEVHKQAIQIGSGMLKVGMPADNTCRIGIYSRNRVEYVITELACYAFSRTIVPLYDTLGPESCTYIINQADIEMVVCESKDKVESLLKRKDETPNLKIIVCIEEVDSELRKAASVEKVELIEFAELRDKGRQAMAKPKPCSPGDLCVICYTSGTTGVPKGAMITHTSVMSSVSGILKLLECLKVHPEDVAISYLPLAHMYERINMTFMLINGARIGFYQGDIRKLMDDIQELRPTLFPCVPRLLNRVYDKVMANVSGSVIKKTLLEMAISQKSKLIGKGVIVQNTIWDALVFKKIQQTLGGRVKYLFTGSAPLSEAVMNFVRCATGAVVLEGYGQTESSAVASLQFPGEFTAGNVGPPIPSCMFKLEDVPEMNYFAKDQKGEILVKGPLVFKGYLKNPQQTAEALDKDGWLHTGDIGMWMPNGTMKIIDRKKNIFKLAQGEYIAPEKIENVYVRCGPVSQVYVHGESLKSCLIGIVVPDQDTFCRWVKNALDIEGTIAELCQNPQVKKAVLDDLIKTGKDSGLNSYEQVKDIHLHPQLFSVENGLLTPTFKSKRQEIKKRFETQIERMYSKLS